MEDSLEFAAHSRQTEDEPAQNLYQALRLHHDFLLDLYLGLGKNQQEFQEKYRLLLNENDTDDANLTNRPAQELQERDRVLQDYYEALQYHHAFVQDYLDALQDHYPLVLSLIQQENTNG